MKVLHRIVRAVKAPDMGKVYGAQVTALSITGQQQIVFGWSIFARKLRGRKKKVAK